MKNAFKMVLLLALAGFLAGPVTAEAMPGYRSVLKKWTREDRVWAWDNLEVRMIWHATCLSEEFRKARRERLAGLYEWTPTDRARAKADDESESRKYDVFFLSIYAGSSQWSDIGKNDGEWKIVLETDGRPPVESLKFEKISVTQAERTLYPFIDSWSHTYLVKFPKTISEGVGFRLKMTGIPARSELVWKNPRKSKTE